MNSIFNVLGPVMVGPSSSHTAGAGNIGRVAYMLANGEIKAVEFILHGSFAKTGAGHGTDKALVAGVLGMSPDDERLRDAFNIAKEKGVDFKFVEEDLGTVHPNSVKIKITKNDGSEFSILASSVGGGNININAINDVKAEFSGKYSTLIVNHLDKIGMISKITYALAMKNVNIVTLKLSREGKGSVATSVVEIETPITEEIIEWIKNMEDVIDVIYMDRI